MERIKKILHMRKTDKEKLDLISEYINNDNSKNYGFNNRVQLNDHDYAKLVESYGLNVIKNIINNLDGYLYKSGKSYVNHYLTILNWLRREGVKELPKVYICSYGQKHKSYEECSC